MSMTEFLSWQEYYAEAPFDDHHRFHRPAVLVSSSMAGGDARDKFEFLVPMTQDEESGFSSADLKTLAAFGVKRKQEI